MANLSARWKMVEERKLYVLSSLICWLVNLYVCEGNSNHLYGKAYNLAAYKLSSTHKPNWLI